VRFNLVNSHRMTNTEIDMTSYHKENQEATKEAELAREKAREVACEALRYARQCKGEDVDPSIKQMASTIGKEAAELRKQAKAKAAKAAEARRIACKRAMGEKPVPPLPREAFNGGKMPMPPNRR
jgi:hypothetical protein